MMNQNSFFKTYCQKIDVSKPFETLQNGTVMHKLDMNTQADKLIISFFTV